MTNALILVKALDTPTPNPMHKKVKPRRMRRQEQRDRAKAAKLNEKKNDRLSA